MNCQGRLFELVTLELRPEGSERASLGEKHFKQNEQHVQRACSGCVLGSFEEQQGSQGGWSMVREGQSSKDESQGGPHARSHRVSQALLRTFAFSLNEMGAIGEFRAETVYGLIYSLNTFLWLLCG